MSKQQKQGYLGPAFHEWMEWLEYCECMFHTEKVPPGKPKHMALNDTLFRVKDDADMVKMMNDALPVDAWLARCVRSSVKYKVDAETFAGLIHHYEDELKYIRKTVPINLPHEWCSLVVDWGEDSYLISAQETTTRDGGDYPELEVAADEPWICMNMMLYRQSGVEVDHQKVKGQPLSYVPVEIHFQKGKVWEDTKFVTATTPGVETTEKGQNALDIFRAFFLIWLEQFYLQSVLRHKAVSGGRPPIEFKPAKPRKRRQFPKFEHTVIELQMDAPDCQQIGKSVFQPKKRLHQVRGFYRHYRKTGKRVWVKPHWRGDEALGVVRRDFELTTREEGECHGITQ